MYNLKNMKNTHRGGLLLVKLQASASKFNKSNAPPMVVLHIFQIAQIIPRRYERLLFMS